MSDDILVIFGLYTMFWIMIMAMIIIHNIGLAIIFSKHYNEHFWKALIPLYNSYLVCKYTFGNGWLFLSLFIPGLNTIAILIIHWFMIKQLKRSPLAFLATLLLGGLALMVIALSENTEYIGPDTSIAKTLGLRVEGE